MGLKIRESVTREGPEIAAIIGQRCAYPLDSWDADRCYRAARFGNATLLLGTGTPISAAAAETLAESANILLPENKIGVVVDYHNDHFYVLYFHDVQYFLYCCTLT